MYLFHAEKISMEAHYPQITTYFSHLHQKTLYLSGVWTRMIWSCEPGNFKLDKIKKLLKLNFDFDSIDSWSHLDFSLLAWSDLISSTRPKIKSSESALNFFDNWYFESVQ